MANVRLVLVIVFLIQINVCTSDESYCPQLGCDGAGTFKQDDFELPVDGQRTVAWSSAVTSQARMNQENENYGCVGSSKIVVCPLLVGDSVRHVMLNTDTGAEYDPTGYDTLDNVNMPILTKDNQVFATNSTHASLVDPINKRSFITKLPTDNPQGMHSTLYLPELNFFVVVGNLSVSHSIYKIGKDEKNESPELNLVTKFQVERDGYSCPWLPLTELVANGNRAYFYSYHKQEQTAIIAMEFMAESPFYKKAWEVLTNSVKTQSQQREDDSDSCTIVPNTDQAYLQFPPMDICLQMLATPDNYVVITTPVGLMVLIDGGDAGQGLGATIYGTHFLSLDTAPTVHGDAPIVWMTGWSLWPPFRTLLNGFNYTNEDIAQSANWYIELTGKLDVSDVNITSRITMFKDKESDSNKMMVFGATIYNTKSDSTFLTTYCTDCKVGMNHVVMAVRTEYKSTADPHIYWMTKISDEPHAEVRGQIIGVSDKIVMYLSNGNSGKIIALQ